LNAGNFLRSFITLVILYIFYNVIIIDNIFYLFNRIDIGLISSKTNNFYEI